MSEEEQSIEELDDLVSIERYIEVLLDKYPISISQTELAKESRVTKSAITRIRKHLATVCNIKVMAVEKKLLLNSDSETFSKLLMFFVVNRLKPQVFFQSRYLKTIIKALNIHEKLSRIEDSIYAQYFDEPDTNKMIEIVLHNLANIQSQQLYSLASIQRTKTDEKGLMMRLLAYFPILNDPKINFAIFQTQEELTGLLQLRDKLFFFIKHLALKLFQSWELVQSIKNEEDQNQHVQAYLYVVDYYARKVINQFTDDVVEKAQKLELDFNQEFYEIGAIFQPEHYGDMSQGAVRRGNSSIQSGI
ncbi:MAG: hypothetical protein ACXACD_13645 [Candidatus Thorarchaeota archaeon]|jgi:hypothetical protein